MLFWLATSVSATFIPVLEENENIVSVLDIYMGGDGSKFVDRKKTFYSDVPFLWVNPLVDKYASQMKDEDTIEYKTVCSVAPIFDEHREEVTSLNAHIFKGELAPQLYSTIYKILVNLS